MATLYREQLFYYSWILRNRIQEIDVIWISISQILLEVNNNKEKESLNPSHNQPNKFNIKIVNKENSIEYIDLDIERTFSYLGIFKKNSPLSEDLREILSAFVASRPDIGYVSTDLI